MPKPIVLVVDDSVTVRAVIQRTLQSTAFTLAFAGDGLSALTAVADLSPAVLLLDVHLPHMNGYTICQLLRKNVLYRDIPIVMLTGHSGLGDRIHGRLVGATDYLAKPFDPKALRHIVQKHLAHWYERPFTPYQEEKRLWMFSDWKRRM